MYYWLQTSSANLYWGKIYNVVCHLCHIYTKCTRNYEQLFNTRSMLNLYHTCTIVSSLTLLVLSKSQIKVWRQSIKSNCNASDINILSSSLLLVLPSTKEERNHLCQFFQLVESPTSPRLHWLLHWDVLERLGHQVYHPPEILLGRSLAGEDYTLTLLERAIWQRLLLSPSSRSDYWWGILH